jgi:RimJ/RimL family protein N-acetyltransferase
MRFQFTPLTEKRARAIATWRYEPPYDFYNAGADSDDLRELLDRASPYCAATDELGALVGFLCFRSTAQVPAGNAAGAYDDPDGLDIGLGLHPHLTGRGLGLPFVQAGLEFARATLAPASFRLSVATFNRRAILVSERAGFVATHTFMNRTNGGTQEFVVMARPATP